MVSYCDHAYVVQHILHVLARRPCHCYEDGFEGNALDCLRCKDPIEMLAIWWPMAKYDREQRRKDDPTLPELPDVVFRVSL
jgi:hypothetical protein